MTPTSVGASVENQLSEQGRRTVEAMDAHGAQLHRFLLRLTENEADANDLSQELWVRVYKKARPENFHNLRWLHTVARNLFLDFKRRGKTRGFVQSAEKPPEIAVMPACEHSGSLEEEKELYERFWRGFPSINLSDQDKSIFWLYERYGYTYREVAEKVGKGRTAIMFAVKRCRNCCLEYLNKEDEDARS